MRRSWLMSRRWSAALIGIVVVLVGALVVSTLGIVGGAPAAGTSVAIMPSATPTLIVGTPTPTVLPGFSYYTESSSNFQIQYPTGWMTVAQNPGVEIDDNGQNPTYVVQVLLPTENLNLQTDWIQYEFNSLRQSNGTSHFIQLSNSTTPLIVGGEQWESGTATLQQGTNVIAVQVLATVHQNRAYIINLLAANVPMATAQQQYFANILDTFAFLT
jgi:hypothetical protein